MSARRCRSCGRWLVPTSQATANCRPSCAPREKRGRDVEQEEQRHLAKTAATDSPASTTAERASEADTRTSSPDFNLFLFGN